MGHPISRETPPKPMSDVYPLFGQLTHLLGKTDFLGKAGLRRLLAMAPSRSGSASEGGRGSSNGLDML